jgi:peptidoglycan/xylan/chitin deacetylase (PgdA/CDA1 family)
MDLQWLWLRSLPKSAFVWKGKPFSRRVALTFDDGPHNYNTADYLHILKKNGISATFFLSGSLIAAHPDLLLKIHMEGHEIGNHSYNHRSLVGLEFAEIVEELNLTQEIIKKHTGHKAKLFRPPYGAINLKVIRAAGKCKMTTVLWTVDPKDYSLAEPAQVIEKLRAFRIRGGEIILHHTDSEATLNALPGIINDLRDRGIEMTSVSNVI